MAQIRENDQLYTHYKVSTITGTPLTVAGVLNTVNLNPVAGLNIPDHNTIEFTYNDQGLVSSIAYKVNASGVANLSLTYSGGRLFSIVKS